MLTCEPLVAYAVIQCVVLVCPALSLDTGLYSARGRVKLTVPTLEPRFAIAPVDGEG